MNKLSCSQGKRLGTNGKGKGSSPNSLANLVVGRARLQQMRDEGTLPKPVGYSLTSALKHALGNKIEQPALDDPARDHIVYQTIQGALKREPNSQNIVWDRLEGKLGDTKGSEGTPNQSINFIIVGKEGEELLKGITRRLSGATE